MLFIDNKNKNEYFELSCNILSKIIIKSKIIPNIHWDRIIEFSRIEENNNKQILNCSSINLLNSNLIISKNINLFNNKYLENLILDFETSNFELKNKLCYFYCNIIIFSDSNIISNFLMNNILIIFDYFLQQNDFNLIKNILISLKLIYEISNENGFLDLLKEFLLENQLDIINLEKLQYNDNPEIAQIAVLTFSYYFNLLN